MSKKNIAVLGGLCGVLIWVLPDLFCQQSDSSTCKNILPFFTFLIPHSFNLIALLLVSIFTYFTQEEIHSFWFKWMVLRYLPITTVLILLTYNAERNGGGGLGVVGGGSGTVAVALLFSVLFIILSIFLVVFKFFQLRKRK